MPFLSDQKHWRTPRPPPTLIFSSKSPDQNFEIAILFNIVKKPKNYVFGDDLLPHSPRGRGHKLQNSNQCLHIVMVIGKCTDTFRGFFGWEEGLRGWRYVGETFQGGICHGGKEFPWRGRRAFLAIFFFLRAMKKWIWKSFFNWK